MSRVVADVSAIEDVDLVKPMVRAMATTVSLAC